MINDVNNIIKTVLCNLKLKCSHIKHLNCRYALGGYNGAEMVPTVEIFDPRLGSWMLGEPMNNARGYSGAAAIKEKIFVIGGVNESDEILDTVHLPCYNSVTFYVCCGVTATCFSFLFS